MSNGEHQFFMDSGFFSQKVKDIVEEISKEISSLSLYNYEDGNGYKRSWLSIENLGEPFNSSTARDVIARIEDELDEDEIYESNDDEDDEDDEDEDSDEDDEDNDYVEDDDDPYSGWKW